MKLTPELEMKGLRAYEQARAYEAQERRGLPWIYTGFSVMQVMIGVATGRLGHPSWSMVFLLFGIFFGVFGSLSWRWQTAQYEKNLQMLADLEKTYGDQLPWIQVEKHLAELEKLKQDLAEEKIGAALKDVVDERRRESDL